LGGRLKEIDPDNGVAKRAMMSVAFDNGFDFFMTSVAVKFHGLSLPFKKPQAMMSSPIKTP